MHIEELEPDLLWRYYQRGYNCLVRSGRYFRQVLRPALSHVYFQRALPLLVEYARANHGRGDLSPGFGDQMEACPLTARDLLHLDYAICLGYAEAQGTDQRALAGVPVLEWPGPSGRQGLFVVADAWDGLQPEEFPAELMEEDEESDEEEEEQEEGPDTPFDL
jgi:hypothetical protein